MLNSEIVLRDTYKLLCVFMADKAIFDITPEPQRVWGGSQRSSEPLFRLRHQYIEDEVNHTLINLAICNRNHMDLRLENHKIEPSDRVCGKLFTNVDAGENVVKLTFREACHKVIHTKKASMTFIENDTVTEFMGQENEPIHHELWLSGSYNKNNWKAELDVLEFLRATADNFDLF